ncbi:MAG: hypothetical protein BroJett007_30440 [Chloroflexota bacterium]|nr:MAG: hypothetical protein BroJett007_30440 [Chloroflexota bacterium]
MDFAKILQSKLEADGSMRHILLYTDEDGAWCASVPSLPGCHSQGATREETLVNIKEAIALYVEALKEDGVPVPDEPEIMVLEQV